MQLGLKENLRQKKNIVNNNERNVNGIRCKKKLSTFCIYCRKEPDFNMCCGLFVAGTGKRSYDINENERFRSIIFFLNNPVTVIWKCKKEP